MSRISVRRKGDRPDPRHPGRHRAARDEMALRESEARFRRIADFGAGDDVGHPARPHPRLRQRGLCEFAGLSREEARMLDWRNPDPPRRPRTGWSRRASPARPAASRSRSRRYLRHDGEWRWRRSVFSRGSGPTAPVRIHRCGDRPAAGDGNGAAEARRGPSGSPTARRCRCGPRSMAAATSSTGLRTRLSRKNGAHDWSGDPSRTATRSGKPWEARRWTDLIARFAIDGHGAGCAVSTPRHGCGGPPLVERTSPRPRRPRWT